MATRSRRKLRPRRPDKKPRKWRRRILYFPLWVIAVLVLTELGLRVAGHLILRGPSIHVTPSADVNYIYTVGDSFTFGMGVQPEQSYPAVLEKLLNSNIHGRRFHVINRGWPGLSSTNAVYGVARTIKEGQPALILVLAGWNANNVDFQQLARAKNRPIPWTTRADLILDNLRIYRLSKQIASHGARTLNLGDFELVPQAPEMDLYDFRAYQEIAAENIRKIAQIAREFDVPLIFLNYPYQDLPENPYSKNEYYHTVFGRTKLTNEDYILADRVPNDEIAIHSVIRHVCAHERISVIDIQQAFQQSGKKDLLQKGTDWHHPTADGYELMAQAVFDAIAPHFRFAPSADNGK